MSPKSRQMLLALGDIVLLPISLLGAVFLGFLGNFNWGIFFNHLLPFTILYLFWLIIFYIFGFYDLSLFRNPFSFYTQFLTGLALALGVGMIFFYLIPFFGITPKTNLVLNVLILGALIFGWRKIFYTIFSSHFLSRVAVIGQNRPAGKLKQEIINQPYLGYKLINIDVNEDIFNQVRQKNINTLIIGEDLSSQPNLLENLYYSLPARINFLNLSQAYETICGKIPINYISQIWFLENLREGERELYDKLKRITDVLLSSFFLLVSLPIWPLIILAIKLEDRGPVFYLQKRIGKDRKPFSLIKFRSMIEGAEKETGPVWAKKEDERVTRVGKFLRRTYFDEIPQMINILRGEISLVGPRPERPKFVKLLEKEISHYHLRHLIKPGFTGLAQIKFKYASSVRDSFEKFQYDLYYLKNRSLILDLEILLKTFQLFFQKK